VEAEEAGKVGENSGLQDQATEGDGMWDKFYMRKDELAVFKARRTLILPLREPRDGPDGAPQVSVSDYLQNPERLVNIVYGPSQYDMKGDDIWRIKLLAITILKWTVCPIYELKMRFEDDQLLAQSGTVALDTEGLPQMFKGMELLMKLNCVTDVVRDTSRLKTPGATCQLEAFADLQIAADLPKVLKMFPGTMAIGDSILDTILAAVEFAAKLKLEKDYLKYVKIRKAELKQEAILVSDQVVEAEQMKS